MLWLDWHKAAIPEGERATLERSTPTRATPSQETVRKSFENLIYDRSKIPDELVETRLYFYTLPGAWRVYQQSSQEPPEVKYEPYAMTPERLSQIQAPVLLIGTKRRSGGWNAAEQAASILPNGRFYLMSAECDGWPQFEAPEEFNEVVLNFLEDPA